MAESIFLARHILNNVLTSFGMVIQKISLDFRVLNLRLSGKHSGSEFHKQVSTVKCFHSYS